MKEFLTNISTANFWIGVVAVGIVINLVSSYLKSPFDKLLLSIAAFWRKFSAKRKARREQLIAYATEDQEFRLGLRFQELRHRSRSTGFLVVAIFVGLLYVMTYGQTFDSGFDGKILLGIAVWLVLFAVSATESALFCSDIVNESLRRSGKSKPPFFMGD